MKKICQILMAGTLSVLAVLSATAQTKTDVNELEVLNQLTSRTAVVNMPVSNLLNAPGNEALRAFFFTPVKDKTVLKGKRIAVMVADGFEEIELTGPVWYL